MVVFLRFYPQLITWLTLGWSDKIQNTKLNNFRDLYFVFCHVSPVVVGQNRKLDFSILKNRVLCFVFCILSDH